MKRATRRRIGGVTAQTGSVAENNRRRPESRAIETFPTGLVMSKHFQEASTGREILMLEVEKVRLTIVRKTTRKERA